MPRRYWMLSAALLLCFSPALLPAEEGAVKHVIHISVDGLNSSLLRELLEHDAEKRYPHFARLLRDGAATLNARTDYAHTDTLPNHTCMLTGRPVYQPQGWDETRHHGYNKNTDPAPGDSLHTQGNTHAGYIASVFDVAHDQGLTTALYASKTKFSIFAQSYDAARGAPDASTPDHGRAKMDAVNIVETPVKDSPVPVTSAEMHRRLLADLPAKHFAYTFVHYREPDTAGHAHGWGTGPWNEAVHLVDGYLGDLLKLVESDPELKGRTVIILSADHGGVPGTREHRQKEYPAANYTIPFIVWGAGVAHGNNLYKINAEARRDPGTERPDYNAAPQPIRNGDGGNLALKLLGLPPIPGSSINAKQDLRVSP